MEGAEATGRMWDSEIGFEKMLQKQQKYNVL